MVHSFRIHSPCLVWVSVSLRKLPDFCLVEEPACSNTVHSAPRQFARNRLARSWASVHRGWNCSQELACQLLHGRPFSSTAAKVALVLLCLKKYLGADTLLLLEARACVSRQGRRKLRRRKNFQKDVWISIWFTFMAKHSCHKDTWGCALASGILAHFSRM